MKQKYTLTIADMDVNVITEAEQESVERIVGILDRKIREIILKSKRCSKNEAALLCALDLCADKIQLKDQLEELNTALDEATAEIKRLNAKLEKLETKSEKLESEKERLGGENVKLRALLDEARNGADITDEDIENIGAPAPIKETLEAELNGLEVNEAEEKAPAKKKSSRNRVGSMFDLLTFSDI